MQPLEKDLEPDRARQWIGYCRRIDERLAGDTRIDPRLAADSNLASAT